eukprot:6048888-Ditylum_brightwellii.AAC.1
MQNERLGGKTQKIQWYNKVRQEVESACTGDQIRSVEQASKSMNHWLTVVPYIVNNCVVGKDAFWDMVML